MKCKVFSPAPHSHTLAFTIMQECVQLYFIDELSVYHVNAVYAATIAAVLP